DYPCHVSWLYARRHKDASFHTSRVDGAIFHHVNSLYSLLSCHLAFYASTNGIRQSQYGITEILLSHKTCMGLWSALGYNRIHHFVFVIVEKKLDEIGDTTVCGIDTKWGEQGYNKTKILICLRAGILYISKGMYLEAILWTKEAHVWL
ncbi:hypothetical protein ACJX0J_020661, partial [Zea mays]